MLGNAPDRIAGHRHGSAFGGAGVPSTFDHRVSGSRWLTSCKPPRLQPSASPAMASAHFMSHSSSIPACASIQRLKPGSRINYGP